jgi:hypothetical protein
MEEIGGDVTAGVDSGRDVTGRIIKRRGDVAERVFSLRLAVVAVPPLFRLFLFPRRLRS